VTQALRPLTLADALRARAAHPDAVPVAGGTDLMVSVNFGRTRPPALLDLSRLEELKSVRRENGSVVIGAGVTFAAIAVDPLLPASLRQAARSVGSPQIRSRATLGGNVATASPAGDGIPVIAAHDGRVVVVSEAGERRVPWEEFFLGPKQTTLAADELVVGVELPLAEGQGSFAKIGPRNAMVIAIAGVCLQLDTEARVVRLALGSVAPTVVRAREAETLAGDALCWDDPAEPPSPALVSEFCRLAEAAAQPIDDVRGTAAYRRHAVGVLSRRALEWALHDRKEAAVC
jgi:CO/xanthine dehydrogenase FAD-binding subunit